MGAVDTNVRRVLGRIVAGDVGLLDARTMQQVADDAVPPDRPGFWTHALMDIGATLCKPRRPLCEACPAAAMVPVRRRATHARASSARRPRDRCPLHDHVALAPRPDRRAPPCGPERASGSTLAAPIGDHDQAAMDRALEALARDGVIELDELDAPDRPRRARLPT